MPASSRVKKRRGSSLTISRSTRIRSESNYLHDHDEDGSSPSSSTKPRIDPTYGQRGVFPGLDDIPRCDELFYGPAEDGLEYLRMVRAEAKTVPNLLVAPNAPAKHISIQASPTFEGTLDEEQGSLWDEAHNDYANEDYESGFYADGAFTSEPAPKSRAAVEEDLDPQEAYYKALSTRYLAFRSQISHPPIATSLLSPTPSPPSSLSRAQWRSLLMHTYPNMRQVAALHQDNVMRAMSVLELLLKVGNLRRGGAGGKGLGAWAWALLIRCRERGEMCSEDIGVLRAVGKRAVILLRKIRSEGSLDFVTEEDRAETEFEKKEDRDGHDVEDETDGQEAVSDGLETVAIPKHSGPDQNPTSNGSFDIVNLERAREQLLASLHPNGPARPSESSAASQISAPETGLSIPALHQQDVPETMLELNQDKENPTRNQEHKRLEVRATLDMIVSIVGDMYGQRDLLEERDMWDED